MIDNTGDLKLSLPELEDDWAWRVEIEEKDSEVLLTLKIARGIFRYQDGRVGHGEVWSGFPINIVRCYDYGDPLPRSYDDIIKDAQKEADNLFERWQSRNKPYMTASDAVMHIVNTVQNTPGVVNTLHFTGNEDV